MIKISKEDFEELMKFFEINDIILVDIEELKGVRLTDCVIDTAWLYDELVEGGEE